MTELMKNESVYLRYQNNNVLQGKIQITIVVIDFPEYEEI